MCLSSGHAGVFTKVTARAQGTRRTSDEYNICMLPRINMIPRIQFKLNRGITGKLEKVKGCYQSRLI